MHPALWLMLLDNWMSVPIAVAEEPQAQWWMNQHSLSSVGDATRSVDDLHSGGPIETVEIGQRSCNKDDIRLASLSKKTFCEFYINMWM